MNGLNSVTLLGTVGSEPDFKQFPNGGSVCNLSLATNSVWVNDKGERQQETEWHRIVAYNNLAKIASSYLKTGSKVCFQGSLRTRSWTDANNIKRYVTEIVVQNINLIDSK